MYVWPEILSKPCAHLQTRWICVIAAQLVAKVFSCWNCEMQGCADWVSSPSSWWSELPKGTVLGDQARLDISAKSVECFWEGLFWYKGVPCPSHLLCRQIDPSNVPVPWKWEIAVLQRKGSRSYIFFRTTSLRLSANLHPSPSTSLSLLLVVT